MRRLLTILAFVACLTGVILSSCKPPAPAPKKPDPNRDTLVIVVGGLGRDRLLKMAEHIDADCHHALVVPVGTWDSYKVPLAPIIHSLPKQKRVLVVHSFAAWHLTEPLPRFDYVVILDPVSPARTGFWRDTLPFPAYAARVDVFNRAGWKLFPRVADIPGTTPIVVKASHDEIAEDAAVIDRVVTNINSL